MKIYCELHVRMFLFSVAPCEYRCGMDDGVCIPNDYVCDGYPDCSNNRDESFCIGMIYIYRAYNTFKLSV